MSIEIGLIIGLVMFCGVSVFFNFRKGGLHFSRSHGPITVNYAERDIHVNKDASISDMDYRILLEAEFHIIQRTLYGVFQWLEPEIKLRMINEIGAARSRLYDNLSTMTGDDKTTGERRVQAAINLEQEFTKMYAESIQPSDSGGSIPQIRTKNPT